MRIIAFLFTIALFMFQGCTSELPTSNALDSVAILSESAVLGKSDNAAGIIRHEEDVLHFAFNPYLNIEIDFFDPFLLCEEGLPAAFERTYLQDVVKETGGEEDWIHRREVAEDITVYVLQGYWESCEALQEMYDQGLVDVGSATYRLNDNDVIGTRDRQNTNTWSMRAHGKTLTTSGLTRVLNFHNQCVWVDEAGPVDCKMQIIYN